jgi:hypothetical protein
MFIYQSLLAPLLPFRRLKRNFFRLGAARVGRTMLASVVRTVRDGRRVVVVVAAADDDTEKEDDTEVNICGKEW